MVEADQKPLNEAAFQERLAQIRHDLKTPVGHIMGYSEMIEEEVEEEAEAEGEKKDDGEKEEL